MPTIGEINVEITATTSRLRANLAQASSLIRDWSLLATGLGQGVSIAFKNIASIGIKAITVSLAALITTFGLIVASGADFQDKITRAFVITQESSNATADSFALLTNEAIRLGNETLFSANKAAEGMVTLARAGFDTGQILASTQNIIDLAVAGNLGLAASADITIASLFGFGLEASETGRIADVLALASAKANTTVELLGSAMSFVAPVSAAAGVSFEATASALAIMANAGIRGSRGGTTLRRALSQLLAPTRQAREVMTDLGVSFTTSRGKLKPLVTIIKDLEKSGITAAQTMQLFGLRAGPGMAALIRLGSAAFADFEEALKGSEGAADRIAQKLRETVTGRVKDLGASVVATGLAFSTQFDTGLADVIFSLRNYIKETTEALEKTKIFKAIVDGVVNALSPLTDKIAELAEKFQEFLTGLTPGDVAAIFDEIKEKVKSVVDAFSDPTNVKIFFNTIKGIGTIISTVVTVISLMVSGFQMLPPVIQENIGPIIIIGGLILALVGGVSSIVILFIALGALIASLPVGFSAGAAAMVGMVIVGKILLILFAAIAIIIAGISIDKMLSEMATWEGASARIVAQWRVLVALIDLAGLAAAAVANPALAFSKKFKNKVAVARERLGIRLDAVDSAGDIAAAKTVEKNRKKEAKRLSLIPELDNVLGEVNKTLGADATAILATEEVRKSNEVMQKVLLDQKAAFDTIVGGISINSGNIQIMSSNFINVRLEVDQLNGRNSDSPSSIAQSALNAERTK